MEVALNDGHSWIYPPYPIRKSFIHVFYVHNGSIVATFSDRTQSVYHFRNSHSVCLTSGSVATYKIRLVAHVFCFLQRTSKRDLEAKCRVKGVCSCLPLEPLSGRCGSIADTHCCSVNFTLVRNLRADEVGNDANVQCRAVIEDA